jgi:hypothetical protein
MIKLRRTRRNWFEKIEKVASLGCRPRVMAVRRDALTSKSRHTKYVMYVVGSTFKVYITTV